MTRFTGELVTDLAREVLSPEGIIVSTFEPDELNEFREVYIKQSGVFEVAVEEGCDPDEPQDIEPQTLYIDDLESFKEGEGVATAVMSNILTQARDAGFTYARAGVHNPRVIRIVQKLVDLGYAKAVGFRPLFLDYGNVNQGISTVDLVYGHDGLKTQEASDFLQIANDITRLEALKTGEKAGRLVTMLAGIKL